MSTWPNHARTTAGVIRNTASYPACDLSSSQVDSTSWPVCETSSPRVGNPWVGVSARCSVTVWNL